jgi:soluble lytic murein transglycosylase-like protein
MPDNAILSDYQGTGAGARTAARDHLGPGPDSSRAMAKTDLARVNAIKDRFNNVAARHDLPPALLAAIASRESRCGNVLQDGWGDGGHAFGIMQVDRRTHVPEGTDDPRSQAHIDQATGILADFFSIMKQKFGDQPEARQLQAAVAAYNHGAEIASPNLADADTTGHDYSNDVWVRATFYAIGW